MTSVNGVSRCPARANYQPPIWENTVSEGVTAPKSLFGATLLTSEFAV